MNSIRQRRNYFALFFAVSISLAVWLDTIFLSEAAFAFGAVSMASLIFLVRQSRLLYDATLIWDNPILAVPSAFISMPDRQMKKEAEKTVVSTFGILIGSEIYPWGLDGVEGVRLHTAHINQEKMSLTFGDAGRTMGVELLHGMNQKRAVLDAAQRLWQETGVKADITGW